MHTYSYLFSDVHGGIAWINSTRMIRTRKERERWGRVSEMGTEREITGKRDGM